MSKIKDLTGKTFGRLTVISLDVAYPNGGSRWLTKCICGTAKVIAGWHLTSGHIKSCGCLQQEKRRARRLPGNETSFRRVYNAYYQGAKRRELEWQLTLDDFRNLCQLSCFYCGSEPTNISQRSKTHQPYQYNGLDRRDSAKGYTINNVVTCCGFCNRAKLDFSEDEFLAWLNRVRENR